MTATAPVPAHAAAKLFQNQNGTSFCCCCPPELRINYVPAGGDKGKLERASFLFSWLQTKVNNYLVRADGCRDAATLRSANKHTHKHNTPLCDWGRGWWLWGWKAPHSCNRISSPLPKVAECLPGQPVRLYVAVLGRTCSRRSDA